MKRRLFNILSALSLVVCIATPVLWVRSLWVADTVHWSSGGRLYAVNLLSVKGVLGLGVVRYPQPHSSVAPSEWQTFRRDQVNDIEPFRWSFLGVAVKTGSDADGQGIAVKVSCWFLLGVSAVLPARWFWVWRRARMIERQGRCRKCGYDLRASPERCPECGTPISGQAGDNIGRG
jgi:hypothetical protein